MSKTAYPQPFSQYEILERVGSGSMGTVFKARHHKLSRIVALKVLRPSLARDARYVDRLRREARIVAALNHPNIVTGHDVGEEGGYHYFVMEFVEGRSLKQLLAEWGAFPEDRVLDLGIQVAEALDHAFRRGVIHRDIKPGNVLIDGHDQVKLTDMGLAKGPTDVTITRHGATVGTPQYISPEQARDPQQADVRSDLYSLGATLFHMVTGTPPFTGDSVGQVLTQVLTDRAPSLTDVNPNASDGLSLVLRKLLAKDPDVRYQTPAELLEDLRRVERQEAPGVDLRRLEQAERGPRSGYRRAVLVGAALALLVVASGAVWAWGAWPTEPSSDAAAAAAGVGAGEATLRGEVARAPGYRARLAAVRAAGAAGMDPAAVAAVRAEVEQGLQGDLQAFVRRCLDGDRAEQVRRWLLDPANWDRSEALVERVLAGWLDADLGIQPLELPAATRAFYQQQLEPLRARVAAIVRERDHEFRELLKDFLQQGLPAAWAVELERNDYRAAARAVAEAVDRFFANPGRPSKDRLPADLSRQVSAGVAVALRRIELEEQRAAENIATSVGAELDRLQAMLRTGDVPASLVERACARWRADTDLAADEVMFRPELNPWRALRTRVEAFNAELRRAVRDEEAVLLDQYVAFAYRALVGIGDAQSARAWLALPPRDAENRALRDRHLELLQAAGELVSEGLLPWLAGRTAQVRLADAPNGPRVLVAVDAPGGGALRLRRSGDGGPPGTALMPADLAWADVLAVARAEGVDLLGDASGADRDRRGAGLALWLMATGATAETMQFLAPPWRAFFTEHVAVPLTAARDEHRARRGDGLLRQLQAVQVAFQTRPRSLQQVEQALQRYPSAPATNESDAASTAAAQLLDEVRAWVAAERARRGYQRELEAALPAGMAEVSVDADGVGVIDYDLPAVLAAARPALSGWSPARGGGLEHRGSDLDLAAQPGLALPMPAALAGAEIGSVELWVDLSVPETAGSARVLVVELAGIGVVFGLLRDGAVASAVVDAAELGRVEVVRRALQRALELAASGKAPAYLLPNVRYRLTAALRLRNKRADVAVRVGGAVVARRSVPRMEQAILGLRLRPLQPCSIDAVSARLAPR